MADVKWIKLATDIFDDEKILLIETMPESDAIIVIWLKLLTLAGKQNNSGVFIFADRIPYTDEMLASIFRRPLTTVRLALQTFEQFGMIEIIENTITIPNWEKHQSEDKLERMARQNRERVRRHREKQKLLVGSGTCQYCGEEATGIDHIIPLARGGTNGDENLVPCCIRCNRIKNDKPLVDFLNANRDIVKDEIVLNNSKLSRYVYLCNITNRYKVMQSNAPDIDTDKDKDLESSSYTDIWKALSTEQIDLIMETYQEGGNLIQEVYEQVKAKRKIIEKPYEYVIGYAENKKWLRSAT